MTDREAVSKGLIVPTAPTVSPRTPTAIPGSSLVAPAEGTITRAIAESFMTEYGEAIAKTDDGILTEAEQKAIVDKVLKELDSSVVPTPDFKQKSDLRVQGSGPEAMRAFAAAAEKVYLTQAMGSLDTELIIFQKYLETNDQTALKQIAEIARLYHMGAVGLSVLPVPRELADIHLKMVNALMRMSESTRDLTLTDSDPVATMIALKQYPEAVKQLGEAFAEVNQIYTRAGIVLGFEEPGVGYVRLIERLVADKQAEEAARQKETP